MNVEKTNEVKNMVSMQNASYHLLEIGHGAMHQSSELNFLRTNAMSHII